MAGRKTLKEVAQENPTLIGDPVSLKAEKSDNSPTENDRPNKQKQEVQAPAPTAQDLDKSSSPGNKDKRSLKELAQQNLEEAKKGNKTMLGDPTSLKAETADRDPVKGEQEDGTGRSGPTPIKRDSKL
jgi:hypothetical protein